MKTVEDTVQLEELQARRELALSEIRKCDAAIYELTPKPNDDELREARSAAKKARKEGYRTKNGLSIHILRSAGYEVKVTHIRNAFVAREGVDQKTKEKFSYTMLVPVPSYLRAAYNFAAKGGATHIVISEPNGADGAPGVILYVVSSVCHEVDSFDYKRGVQYALDQLTQGEADVLLG